MLNSRFRPATSIHLLTGWSALIVLLLTSGCATKGMLGGGPKDSKAPVVLMEEPPHGSIYFKGDEIAITFDEFVKLKDASKNILVSPPLKEQPDYKLRGKTLVIKFNEPLTDSTTYCVFFGDAIIDITEGNALSGYSYVFSTGPVIDSLNISGTIKDAYTGLAVENTFAGLYLLGDTLNVPDSIAMKQAPRYITRCNKDGTFRLGYIAPGRYMVFALNDQNGNYFYNPYSEAFAYVDSVVGLQYPVNDTILDINTAYTDTTKAISLSGEAVSTPIDTIALEADTTVSVIPPYVGPDFHMWLFTEQDSIQRITSKERTEADAIRITYRYPLIKPRVSILNSDSIGRVFTVFNAFSDTIYLWTPAPLCDTVHINITDDNGRCDTIKLLSKKHASTVRRGRGVSQGEHLLIKSNLSGQRLPHFKKLMLLFNQPVALIDTTRCSFVAGTDTLSPVFRQMDSTAMKFELVYKFEQNKLHKLFTGDSTFKSITGLYSIKSSFNFTTSTIEDLGLLRIKLTTNKPSVNHILQWLDDKSRVLVTHSFTSDTTFTIANQMPGKYTLKVILDNNRNNRWDTGQYMKLIQPEATRTKEPAIEIRANWELEEEWNLVF
ncbi:MAG: hypothetical protein CVU06_02890 [Bacteroidetes bacterium HGW-Bacteroidetes-22]|nr:MAG: hypothetical protein CVU06_02890 [Bacteroidetes bacterium HGW-Bacteroidetes-22]